MQSTLRLLVLVSAVMLMGRIAHADADPLGQGLSALDAGRFVEAEGIFRQLVSRQPGLIDAYRGLSRALAGQDRSSEAANILFRLGEGLLQASQHAPAVEVLTEAVELDPDSPSFQALLGKAHLFAQNHLAAAAFLEKAVKLGHRVPTTRLYLAAALWEIGRPAEAEAFYLELMKENSNAFVVVHQLGRLLDWQGRSGDAVVYLRQAAALRPAAADVAYDLAKALAGAGEADEAVAAFRRALTLAPSNYKAHYGLARLLARQGERQEARLSMEAYQRLYAAEQESTHREGLERARLDRGWQLIDDEAFKAAIQHFEGFIEGLGESSEALAGLATAWSRLGNHSRAIEHLERAVSLAPERQDLRLMLAEERLAEEGESP